MLLFGSALLFILVGLSVSGTSDLKNITAEPGDNITLTCEDPENKIITLEWSRSDLQEGECVFSYRSGGVNLDDQHESFQNRVFLKDPQMKNGNLSVVLKNVKINDSGTYMCRIKQQNGPHGEMKIISTINLQVSPPGEEDGRGDKGKLREVKKEDVGGVSRGRLGLIPVPGLLLLLAVVVLAVLLWIYKKKKV
ncbi:V-set domain containing T-cell activation inhibitor 1-like [Oryzias melastigma]|uniref:V-set domain containing T-cell activation inhibitor 1-like n=1 Tax=Oryzias melastigma TaxID=30732 RepID=UPI00168CFF2C|nr:V-set domain containing T-cell activation inhibitor 1-like [Oryzias melastigma]